MNLEEMENPGALFKYENDNIHFFENSPFNTKTRWSIYIYIKSSKLCCLFVCLIITLEPL